jgi:hypothetical protein
MSRARCGVVGRRFDAFGTGAGDGTCIGIGLMPLEPVRVAGPGGIVICMGLDREFEKFLALVPKFLRRLY